MQNKFSPDILPLGLLELDADGTVLYFRPDRESVQACAPQDVVGLNLFTDFAPIAGDPEFQERIKSFRRRYAPAASFHFTFDRHPTSLSVKVLLARIHGQSVLGSTESILIHIRPQARKMAA